MLDGMWTCRSCGKVHDDLPLCFSAEAPWRSFVSEEEFENRVGLTRDQCIIDDKQHFLRGHIVLPIRGSDSSFEWSVWCSVSDESHHMICDRWHLPERAGDRYFGWLSTRLPCYPDTQNLKTNILIREPGLVPIMEIQACDHPLYLEQRDGITIETVAARAHELLHAV
jgi:hypothetical protein